TQIISLYYQCLLQMELLKIKKDLEENAGFQIEVLKKEFEMGRALENDYLEYLIYYKELQNDTKKASRELESCLRQFNVALNLPSETKVEFREDLSEKFSADEKLLENPLVLEKIIDKLWIRFYQTSIDVKKQNITLDYAKKQKAFSEKFYLPEIYLSAAVTLNGTDYPLSEPDYSVKLNVSFPNAKIIPINYTNGYGISKNRLSSVKNSSTVKATPDLTYSLERKNSDISIQTQIGQRQENDEALYETFFNQISTYDDSVDSIKLLNETIQIQKRRLEINEQQVNIGKMRRIDLLDQMSELAGKEIELISSKVQLLQSQYNLEIILDFPFGGLTDACKKYY
ncbi:MAG: hypothetical protein K6G52_07240, partial [Treponemataceae bacterium]|nr:hypothetical protein [Treponemataceae bacterium]